MKKLIVLELDSALADDREIPDRFDDYCGMADKSYWFGPVSTCRNRFRQETAAD